MSRPRPAPRPFGPTLFFLTLLYLGLALAMLASDPRHFYDIEALHNASAARELILGRAEHLAIFQYKDYCGGCTAVSLAGAASFQLLGVSFLSWKLVPIGIGALILIFGAVALKRTAGHAAGWMFALLVAFSPTLIGQSMLMAWGNHYEVVLFVFWQALCVSAIVGTRSPGVSSRERAMSWFFWGLAAGLGFWFCHSSAFAPPALLLVVGVAVQREGVSGRELAILLTILALGLGAGLLPLAWYQQATGAPVLEFLQDFSTRGSPGAAVRMEKLTRVGLWAFRGVLQGTPGQVHGLLSLATVFGLWGAVLAALLYPKKSGLALALLALAAASYVLAPTAPEGSLENGLPAPIDQRYLMPAFLCLLLTAAAGLGALWEEQRGRALAALFAGLIVLPSGIARTIWWIGEGVEQPIPKIDDLAGFDYHVFHSNGLLRLDDETLLTWPDDDWISWVNAQRTLGSRYAQRLIHTDAAGATALLEEIRRLPTNTSPVLHGMGVGLRDRQLGWSEVDVLSYAPQLTAILRRTTPAEAEALATGLWLGNSELMHFPDLEVAGCVLCPAQGEAWARQRSLASLMRPEDALQPQAELPAGGPRRAAILRGAGASYGRWIDFIEGEVRGALHNWEPPDQEAFMDGFKMGRVTRWWVPPAHGTPPWLVP